MSTPKAPTPKHARNSSAHYFGKSAYGFFSPEKVSTIRVIHPEISTPPKKDQKTSLGHVTKKMFHPTTKSSKVMSNLSSICKNTVKRDGFCDVLKPEMYTYMKKRRANYEKNVNLREYANTGANKRVLKENEFKQYDRKSQIKCLPGSDYREEPGVKNKFNFGHTSDVYMNQHLWKRNVFGSQSNLKDK